MENSVIPFPTLRLAGLDDEPGRLLALQRYAILDTGAEPRFDQIVGLVRQILNVPIATVSLVDRDRQWLKASDGIAGGECDRRSAFCDHTIRKREVMVVEDAALDPRFQDNIFVTEDPFIRSYAGAPLMTPDGYNLGALCAIDHVPRAFAAPEREILQRFAALVVDELELRTTASRDFLTGALTRRALIEQLVRSVTHYRQSHEGAALIIIDIDHFKRLNDTHGHATGDVFLRAVVTQCRANLRREQVLGRLGGEEFAVLLPGVGVHDALSCAERLRAAVAKVRVPGCAPISASLGVATLQLGYDVEHWLAAADEALYAAKRDGRDRCVVALGAEAAAA